MTEYRNVSISGKDGEIYKIRKENLEFCDNSEQIFYTNIECGRKENNPELCLGEKEITPMAAYFRNQMKRERMEK